MTKRLLLGAVVIVALGASGTCTRRNGFSQAEWQA